MIRVTPKEGTEMPQKGLTRSDGKYDKLHALIVDVLAHGMTPDHQKADQIVDIFNKRFSKEEKTMDEKEDPKKMVADNAEAVDDSDGEEDAEESKGKVCSKCGAKMECCGESDEEAEEAKSKGSGGSVDNDPDDDNSSDDDSSDSEESEEEDAEESDDDVEEEDDAGEADDEEGKKKSKPMYGKESKESKPNRRGVRELCESHKLKADDKLINDLMSMPESVAKRVVQRLANAERLLRPKSAVKVEEPKKTGIDALEGKQIFNWLKN